MLRVLPVTGVNTRNKIDSMNVTDLKICSSDARGIRIFQIAGELTRGWRQGHAFQPGDADAAGRDGFFRQHLKQPTFLQLRFDKIPDDARDAKIVPGELHEQVHIPQLKGGGEGDGVFPEVAVDIRAGIAAVLQQQQGVARDLHKRLHLEGKVPVLKTGDKASPAL